MISQQMRVLYFKLMGLPMKCNGIIYKTFRAPRKGVVKVHFGPGQKKYIDGWINLDANLLTAKCDVWVDLHNPLPFPDQTVDVFYSHHMIEHLSDSRLPFHFKEMYRCLKPGGCIRIAGPNGDASIQKFIEGDISWFGVWPDNHRSVGGRLVNYLLCRNEHKTILTFSYLEELAENAGFVNVAQCRPHFETNHSHMIGSSVLGTEQEKPSQEWPDTLVIECEKPRQN